MSIVIVGGNEGMACQYEGICRSYGCKAKIFTKENGAIRKKLGSPDLFILFVNTVSHKMMRSTLEKARQGSIPVLRCHSSSASALSDLLGGYCS